MKVVKSEQPNQSPRLVFRESRKVMRIELHKILFCKACRNYTYIHLADGSTCLICYTLAAVRSLLEPQGFVQIHKSYMVNSEFVKTLTVDKSAMLILTNNQKLNVARRMKPVVMKKLFK